MKLEEYKELVYKYRYRLALVRGYIRGEISKDELVASLRKLGFDMFYIKNTLEELSIVMNVYKKWLKLFEEVEE